MGACGIIPPNVDAEDHDPVPPTPSVGIYDFNVYDAETREVYTEGCHAQDDAADPSTFIRASVVLDKEYYLDLGTSSVPGDVSDGAGRFCAMPDEDRRPHILLGPDCYGSLPYGPDHELLSVTVHPKPGAQNGAMLLRFRLLSHALGEVRVSWHEGSCEGSSGISSIGLLTVTER